MESDESDIGDMLEDLLANSEPISSSPEKPKKSLRELNFNFLDSQANMPQTSQANRLKDDGTPSLVHEPEVDSSDDEDKRNFECQKYSDTGRDLKNLLKNESPSQNRFSDGFSKMAGNLNISNSPKSSKTGNSMISDGKNIRGSIYGTHFENSPNSTKMPGNSNISNSHKSLNSGNLLHNAVKSSRDPIFGINIANPSISSAELVERMRGRHPVTISKVRHHVKNENINNDWVIAGVLINRSTTKVSQKGTQYCIWKLSDLSDKMSTISIFLFSGAYKLFWKTTPGSVIGILNPGVMESKDDIDEATLSVDNAQKVMIFGSSPDMAKCKSMKKNGEPCTNIVNLSRCEYCIYHVKLEYNKASKRADIQSNASGRGFGSSLAKNKKAPLSGIYAQEATNFVPVFAKRNEKLHAKDTARLALLQSGNNSAMPKTEKTEGIKKKACAVELTTNQVKKDLERLNKLRGWNSGKQMSFASPLETSKLSPCAKFLEKEEEKSSWESNLSEKSIKSTAKSIKTNSGIEKMDSSIEFMEKSVESNHESIKSRPTLEKSNVPKKSTKSTEKSDESSPTPSKTNYSSRIMDKLKKSTQTIGKSNSSHKLPEKSVKSTHEASKSSPKHEKTKNSPKSIKSSPKSSSALHKTNSSPKLQEKSGKSNPTLGKSNSSPKPEKSPSTIEKINPPPALSVPRLGVGIKGGTIDFSQPITKQHLNSVRLNAARLNASRWIKQNCGALKESNPNKIRESKSKILEAGAKRRREAEGADEENERKAKKTAINDKFKELLEAKSSHVDLIDRSIENDQEKYFEKLEIKERMEDKMLSTFKVDCKAVRCIICKYTSFSASDLCKEKKHPLRVIDATKSFFKCNDCGNRTVSLDRIPNHTCKKCSGSNWIRAAMMSEKKTDILGAKLSIRGGEETFIGSDVRDGNLNLLVPDSGTGT